jgi:phenylalanyl-tRNA synthetase beta chain
MKASYKWLSMLVKDLPSPDLVMEAFTKSGTEVESIDYIGEKLKDCTIVKVLKVSESFPGPGLSQCTVTDGKKEYITISGAPDIKNGMLCAFARPGGKIFDGTSIDEKTIEKDNKKYSSSGMLLSGLEAGLLDNGTHLLDIPEDTPIGTDLSELLGYKDEYIFDLEITPNRSDLLGHLGLSLDLAAVFNKELLDKPKSPAFKEETRPDIPVTIDEGSGCVRYSALFAENLTVKPSPLWLRGLLSNLGIRPINNVVDITNYFMLFLSHPLHAFDYDNLPHKSVRVRKAINNEVFTTLDSQDRKLAEDDIIISSEGEAIALGGVMGGKNTEVSVNTTKILLEAACFEPHKIRKTSSRLNLMSESSHRFERGVDANQTIRALKEAAYLFEKHCNAVCSERISDYYPNPLELKKVTLNLSDVKKVIGGGPDEETMIDILSRLNIDKLSEQEQILTFSIPSNRPDIERSIDLVEEIGRIWGYDNLEPCFNNDGLYPSNVEPLWQLKEKLTGRFYGMGLVQILGNSLDCLKNTAPVCDESLIIPLKNPMSEDFTRLRPSLLPSLLSACSRSFKAQFAGFSCWEIDKVYFYNKEKMPDEAINLGIVLSGEAVPKSWFNTEPCKFGFPDIKGLACDILDMMKIEYKFTKKDCPWAIPDERLQSKLMAQ